MTLDQLRRIMPHAGRRAALFLAPLDAAMQEFQIATVKQQTAFLAQVAHESGSLRYVRELASGEAYEGRADLGNSEPGDGVRFKGRGLIQITGRANYASCSAVLFDGPDMLLERPEMLETASEACRSAAWFWWAHGLNALADRCEFQRITKRINGGLNGQADRLAFYVTALKVLG